MSNAGIFRRFAGDQRGATATEYAILVPVILLFLFGIIDVGRYAWQFNEDEKATQTGARMAVVTNVVAGGLATQDYVGQTVGGTTLTQGDTIPAAALGLITCTSSSCTCTTSPCPSSLNFGSADFTRIVTRMREIDPKIQASNVVIEFRGSGVGYAGDPSGIQISPLTTVRLTGMSYVPLSAFRLPASIKLPLASYTLTMEDGSGTNSN